MPTFEWKGTARNGQTQTGVLVADSKDAVIAMMRRQQIVVTAVKEKGKEIALPKFGGRVPPQLIAIFTRQFSVMIDAGLPLVQCLEILGNQEEDKNFAAVILAVRADVEAGPDDVFGTIEELRRAATSEDAAAELSSVEGIGPVVAWRRTWARTGSASNWRCVRACSIRRWRRRSTSSA